MNREWKKAPLGALCTVCAGGTPSRANPDYWDGDTPWVKISDMLQGIITKTDERITRLGLENSAAKLLPRGTLLLSIFATIGRTAVLGIEAATNQAIVGLSVRDLKQLNSDFLRRFLELKTVELEGRARGVAQANINGAILKALEIPLPPLAEQRRIAEVLDRAEALRAKRRAALAQLDSLTQSLFLDLFGDPKSNSKKWPRAEFGELLANIDSGWSPVCLSRQVSGDEWGVLKLGAVTRCEYNALENKALPRGIEPDPSIEVKPGDLLFTRKNTYELVAACALVRDTPPRLMMSDLMFRFRLRSDVEMDATFLHQLLILPTKRSEIQKLAGGSSGSMPNISKARLLAATIEVPPLSLQREFARRVTAVEKIKASHRVSLAELDALFASLQHCAFRGEL